jgi:hypothetical protein
LGFSPERKRSKKKQHSEGRHVETAQAMEIDQGGLRQHLFDDFHPCLKKAYAKTASAFFTVTTGPTTIKLTTGAGNKKGPLRLEQPKPEKLTYTESPTPPFCDKT